MTPGGVLDKNDLTPDEKRGLYALMDINGASEGFSYDRFFRVGFQKWEIDGIWLTKIDYLRHLQCKEKIEMEVRCVKTIHTPDGDIFKHRYFYNDLEGKEQSFDINHPGDFWIMLGELRHRTHFGAWMACRGMRSQTTVTKRFSADDWKQYELRGIQSVASEFCELVKQ